MARIKPRMIRFRIGDFFFSLMQQINMVDGLGTTSSFIWRNKIHYIGFSAKNRSSKFIEHLEWLSETSESGN